MTSQEKAQELVDKYRTYIRVADKYENNNSEDEIYLSKQCALIAVDEIIKSINPFGMFLGKDYWEEVRDCLENY